MLDELPRWPVLIGFAVFLLPSSDIPTRLIATWYQSSSASALARNCSVRPDSTAAVGVGHPACAPSPPVTSTCALFRLCSADALAKTLWGNLFMDLGSNQECRSALHQLAANPLLQTKTIPAPDHRKIALIGQAVTNFG